ncbi:MAG TPA: DUF4339 domain-containing protein [Labilithrix sp.]|nr:DUF4339 domain-containing protein [Labilithrix sp.]
MSNDLWRWADPDGQQRRVRLDELRAALAGGHIAPNTPVWRSGWIGWQSAHEVPELQSSALSAANGVVPNIPPPPLAMVAMQHAFEANAGGTFSQPPPVPAGVGNDEPPPPPHYVPVTVKPNSIPPAGPSSGRLPATGTGPHPAVTGPMTSTLPTTVGLPPPPELLAMVGAHRAGAPAPAPAPSLLVPGANGGAAKDPMIEELSGSMLLEEDLASRPGLPGPVGTSTIHARGDAALPPPTDPVLRDHSPDPTEADLAADELDGLPPRRRPQLTAIFDDLNEIKAGRPPKNKLLVGVIAFIGLMLIISLLALVVSAIRGKPSELPSADTSGSGSAVTSGSSAPPSTREAASSTAAPPVVASASPPKVEEPKPAESGLGDCALAGEAHVVSPRAFIQSGVEAVAVPGAIALGFAVDPRNGLGITVDPASIGITTTVKARTFGGDARRMSPLLERGKLTLVADVDKKIDRLQVRRVVATSPAIDVGIAENAVVWAPHGLSSYAKIFMLDGDGAADALRAVPLGSTKGIAVALRRGNAILVGTAKGEATLAAEGSLAKISGLGQVGSPTLAVSGDTILVAWSDRATAQEPWQVRWTKLTVGGAPDAPKTLALPEGGLGAQAMSPSVTGLGAGRFVMAWSEGTPSHQVRAQTFSADGAPSGAAFTASAAGINAGQPQIAVGADGRGVVAFLAAKGKAYEIHATPVTCAAK